MSDWFILAALVPDARPDALSALAIPVTEPIVERWLGLLRKARTYDWAWRPTGVHRPSLVTGDGGLALTAALPALFTDDASSFRGHAGSGFAVVAGDIIRESLQALDSSEIQYVASPRRTLSARRVWRGTPSKFDLSSVELYPDELVECLLAASSPPNAGQLCVALREVAPDGVSRYISGAAVRYAGNEPERVSPAALTDEQRASLLTATSRELRMATIQVMRETTPGAPRAQGRQR